MLSKLRMLFLYKSHHNLFFSKNKMTAEPRACDIETAQQQVRRLSEKLRLEGCTVRDEAIYVRLIHGGEYAITNGTIVLTDEAGKEGRVDL